MENLEKENFNLEDSELELNITDPDLEELLPEILDARLLSHLKEEDYTKNRKFRDEG